MVSSFWTVVSVAVVAAAVGLRHMYRGDRNEVALAKQEGKVFVISGGSSGLGLATAQHLVRTHAGKVVLICRRQKQAQEAKRMLQSLSRVHYSPTRIEVELVDLADLASVKRFADAALARGEMIDALILNAGVMGVPYSTSKQGFELHYAVNVLGHFALTVPLVPIVKRVVSVSSAASRMTAHGNVNFAEIEHRGHGALYGDPFAVYAETKLCNLLFANGLRARFPKLQVVSTHPGWTHTELQRHLFLVDALSYIFSMDANLGSLTQTIPAIIEPLDPLGPLDWYVPSGWKELTGGPIKASTVLPYAANQTAIDLLWEMNSRNAKL